MKILKKQNIRLKIVTIWLTTFWSDPLVNPTSQFWWQKSPSVRLKQGTCLFRYSIQSPSPPKKIKEHYPKSVCNGPASTMDPNCIRNQDKALSKTGISSGYSKTLSSRFSSDRLTTICLCPFLHNPWLWRPLANHIDIAKLKKIE
jgi:hypothetical protein